jgi:Na+/H+ antiporter NhaB
MDDCKSLININFGDLSWLSLPFTIAAITFGLAAMTYARCY